MNVNQVVLYGVGGADKTYRVLKVWMFYEAKDIIHEMMSTARWMKVENPSIKEVYAMDNRPSLYRDYLKAKREDSIESHYLFYDIRQRYGSRLNV